MKKERKHVSSHKILLCILCLVLFISHIFYVLKTRQYPQWDEHSYLGMMIHDYDILRTGNIKNFTAIFSGPTNRQPVFPLILSLLLFFTGILESYKVALLTTGLFFVTSVIGVFYLCREFFDDTISLLSSIIFGTLGNALFYSHFTYTETIVTTFVVWTSIWLLKSALFTKRKESILAAIFFCLATLTRWIAPVFVVGPLFIICLKLLHKVLQEKKVNKEVIINILLFIFIAFFLPFIIYFIPNWSAFSQYIRENQQQGKVWVEQYRSADMADTFSTHSVMYYFNIISQNTVFISLAFLAGFFVCLIQFKKLLPLLVAFVVPYAFLTFVTVWKDDRFLVPLYPFFAIITAASVVIIHNKLVRIFFVTLLISLSMLNFSGAVWAIGPMGQRGLTDIVLPAFIHHPRRIYLTPLVWPPNQEYVNAHQLFDIIKQDPHATVLQLFSYEPWDNAVYSIMSYEKRNWFQLKKISDGNIPDVRYILTKNITLDNYLSTHSILGNSTYTLVGKIYVPIDQSTVFIYKK